MPDRMFEVAKELHDYIKNEYKSTCCRVITKWQGDNLKARKERNTALLLRVK